MYALAKEGMAPKIFVKKNRWDVPMYALFVSALPSVLAYMSVKVSSNNVPSSPSTSFSILPSPLIPPASEINES